MQDIRRLGNNTEGRKSIKNTTKQLLNMKGYIIDVMKTIIGKCFTKYS